MNETPDEAVDRDDEEPDESEPKPVDNPDLPEDGDRDGRFREEPVEDIEFEEHDEAGEQREEPNDLSEVDKEFDD